MSTLNRYVLNHAHLEGSMIEAYTTEEAVNCCTRYIRDGRAIGMPIHHHKGRTSRIGCTGQKVRTDVPNEIIQQVHHNILHQLVVMETYIDKHLEEIRATHDGQRSKAWVQNSTTAVLQSGSNSLTYPMEKTINHQRPLRGLHLTRPPKSPHGKGMTSMDTSSIQKRRTRRARHKTTMLDMRDRRVHGPEEAIL
jgi:hypothetical protein